MDSQDQDAELGSGDLITSQIGADDLHGEFSIGRCGSGSSGILRLPAG
jgi:hypothetical protein